MRNERDLEVLAMDIFHFQAVENPVYAAFLSHLEIVPSSIHALSEIPFLPIELFKSHRVVTGKREPALHFESSGTTGQEPSRHFLVSEGIYQESFLRTFTANYGRPDDLCILALLPSYLERQHSSLVYMMDHLIRLSNHPDSGFYLDDLEGLGTVLQQRTADGQPTLLLGVSFALLDLAENYPGKLSPNITLMETGGMKGRRREMIREELHAVLKKAFFSQEARNQEFTEENTPDSKVPGKKVPDRTIPGRTVPGRTVPGNALRNQAFKEAQDPGRKGSGREIKGHKVTGQEIHSEYGMTELHSQAYSKDGKRFNPPPWMRVVTRDLYDPLSMLPPGRSGGINVIDLANLWSCSFIATGDVGKVYADGSFEITGRFDQAEVRGCNLMVI